MKTKRKIITFSLILIICFFISSGCLDDVPHNNPLDPANANRTFTLSGQVGTFYQPRKPISGANIQIEPLDIIAVSNAEGRYAVNNLSAGTYHLKCTASGYSALEMQLEIKSDQQQDFLLDGLPQFEEIVVNTHHRSRWFPTEEIYYLVLYTKVTDPDGIGDISTVFCRIDEYGIVDTLQGGINAGVFTQTLFSPDLPIQSIHQLIGKKIEFFIEDDFGIQISSDPVYLTRIIDQSPLVVSPSELATVSANNILFKWERVFLPYAATLSIEIFRINLGLALKLDTISDIAIDKTEYTYTRGLAQGDYYWTILIVDEFGNSSSSREGVFRVE